MVDSGRDRRLDERARVLGFDDLRGYLQARCDAGSSIPRIATELGVRDWLVQAALSRLRVRLAPRPQRLAAQRRRHTEQRIAARMAELGFADVGGYLVDRVIEQGVAAGGGGRGAGRASADGAPAAGPPRDPPAAAYRYGAGGVEGRASGAGGGVAGAPGGAADGAGLCGCGRAATARQGPLRIEPPASGCGVMQAVVAAPGARREGPVMLPRREGRWSPRQAGLSR